MLLSKTRVSFYGRSKVDLSWQVVGHNNCRVCAERRRGSKGRVNGIVGTERDVVVEESTELNCIIPFYVRISLPRCRSLISEKPYSTYDSGYRAIDVSRTRDTSFEICDTTSNIPMPCSTCIYTGR